ncbi:MAG: hypothetical protein V4502_09230 [Pseudomonadota bacterium]
MTHRNRIALIVPALAAALALGAAVQHPSVLAQAMPGSWEVRGVPGKGPVRECVADLTLFAHYEHRHADCSLGVTREAGDSAVIDYSCRDGDFGHSKLTRITPRALRIETQGISDNLPFSYVLQAHRVGDCPAAANLARH